MVKTNFNSKRNVKVPIFPFQPPSSVLQWPLSRFLWCSFTSSWSVRQLTYRWALAICALRLPKERCFPVWTRRFPSPNSYRLWAQPSWWRDTLRSPGFLRRSEKAALSWDSCLCGGVLCWWSWSTAALSAPASHVLLPIHPYDCGGLS